MTKKLKKNPTLDIRLKDWQKKKFKLDYLNTVEEEQLADLIKYLSDWYYNDEPLVEDSLFDKIFDTLKRRNPKHKALQKVRAPVKVPTRKKIKLSTWMSSLDKFYPNDGIEKWVEKQNMDTLSLSDKLDGFSIEIVYDAKGEIQLSSGGDGLYGQDLNHLIQYFDIPKDLKSTVVRCEGVMITSKHSKFADLFKTPRTALSNVFNSSKPNMEAVKATRLVALELIKPKGLSAPSQFKKLKSMGFEVPHSTVVSAEDVNDEFLRDYYETRRSKTKYPIDGIVVKVGGSYVLPTSGNPKYAVAFKENSEDNFAEAKVIRVEGNTSRTGRIIPLVHIEPTTVQGVTITKLTGHNYGFIRDNKINTGAVLHITRSGEVIPYISSVITPAKTWSKPTGKEGVDWEWATDVDVKTLSSSSEDKDTILIKKLEYFAATMGIVGLKGATAATLYYGGITTPYLLVTKYSEKLFNKIEGIGPNQARILSGAVDEVLGSGVEIPLLATALAAFGPGIGYSKIKAVHESLNFETLRSLSVTERKLKISELRGFTEASALPIATNIDRLYEWIERSGISIVSPGIIAVTNNVLNGRSFMFTGFRSSELEDWVLRHGGKIVSTVGQCDTLLVKDIKAPPSSKVLAAQAKNKTIQQVSDWIKFWVKDESTDVYKKLL